MERSIIKPITGCSFLCIISIIICGTMTVHRVLERGSNLKCEERAFVCLTSFFFSLIAMPNLVEIDHIEATVMTKLIESVKIFSELLVRK